MNPTVLKNRRLVLAPAEQAPHSERARLINEAYAGYYVPLRVTAEQIPLMDKAHDADLQRSVVAYVGAEPVGLALLARRGRRGWIHSVGTLPAWRRCGIARAMLAQVIAAAAETGVEELSLEALTQNTPALRLYESLGFRPRRELLTWRWTDDEGPLPIPRRRLAPAVPADLFGQIASWRDQPPCWQREVESLAKIDGTLSGYRLLSGEGGSPARRTDPFPPDGDGLDGCCLASASVHGVSIMAAAVRPGADALLNGRILLQALSALFLGKTLSMLNVPADDSLCRVLAALRFTVTARQIEMVLDVG